MQTTASLGTLARACLVFSLFWTVAAQREPQHEPAPAVQFDTLAAWREGWTVSECGSHPDGIACIQLQRLDCPDDGSEPVFASDGDAWKHVLDRARAGSRLHVAALALVDRHERRLIEVACGPCLTRPD